MTDRGDLGAILVWVQSGAVGRRFQSVAWLRVVGSVQALCLSGSDTLITASGQRGTNMLQVWSLGRNQVVARLQGPMSSVLSLWAKDGRIACGDQSGQIQLYELPARLSPDCGYTS